MERGVWFAEVKKTVNSSCTSSWNKKREVRAHNSLLPYAVRCDGKQPVLQAQT